MEPNRHCLPLLLDANAHRSNGKIETTVRTRALPFLDPTRTALDDADFAGSKVWQRIKDVVCVAKSVMRF